MTGPFPDLILPKHLAIFGMTGSGKSTTGRDLVEQVVPAGSRVCILDTVKSDWWGITSSADGKRPGLPFTILGGLHKHLPLSRNMGKAIGEMVASGALPHSIIDMVDFEMGDPAHFFVDFAQALMRKMKGVLYLIIEEAHEIAPKERAGFERENLGVYWAKKLAIAGRTRGIRLVVLSQRVQSLHNAVIGSCETLVVHRMTAPADQKPVVDWLKGNVKDVKLRKQIEESMSSLADGQGYLCSGSAKIFDLVQFPRSKTFDNTATPEDDSALQEVKTAKVDVAQLQALLGEAVKEAEANDPVILRRRIAELERAATAKRPIIPNNIPAPPLVAPPIDLRPIQAAARKEGWDEAIETVKAHHRGYIDGVRSLTDQLAGQIVTEAMDMLHGLEYEEPPKSRPAANTLIPPAEMTKILQRPAAGDGVALTSMSHPQGPGVGRGNGRLHKAALETIDINVPMSRVQNRILDALAELEQMGAKAPPPALLAFMAGYSNLGSKGFRNALSSLRAGGLVKGTTLTEEGRSEASPSNQIRTAGELQQRLMTLLGGASERILQPVIDAYPRAIERNELGRAAGYGHTGSKGFRNALSRLRTLGFVDYRADGVVAMPVLFLEHS